MTTTNVEPETDELIVEVGYTRHVSYTGRITVSRAHVRALGRDPGNASSLQDYLTVADDDTGPEGFYWAAEVSSNDTERRGEEDDPTLESVTIKS